MTSCKNTQNQLSKHQYKKISKYLFIFCIVYLTCKWTSSYERSIQELLIISLIVCSMFILIEIYSPSITVVK